MLFPIPPNNLRKFYKNFACPFLYRVMLQNIFSNLNLFQNISKQVYKFYLLHRAENTVKGIQMEISTTISVQIINKINSHDNIKKAATQITEPIHVNNVNMIYE